MTIILELVVVLALLGFVGNGARAGFIETLGRLVGAVIGYLVARSYSGWLVGLIGIFVPPTWAFLISFAIIFLVVDHLVGILFQLAGGLLKVVTWFPIIKQIDGLLGGIIGFVEGIVVIGGISWLLAHSVPAAAAYLANLRTLSYIDGVFGAIVARFL